MAAMAAIFRICFAPSSGLKGQLTRNLVGSMGRLVDQRQLKLFRLEIQGGGHRENLFLASSPELKGQLSHNLAGGIRAIFCRSKVAKIVPI